MSQKKEITLKNFWDYTWGVWESINFELGQEDLWALHLIAKSPDGSHYFVHNHEVENPSSIIRVSNHWGGGIGTCNWYLNGHFACNSYKFKEENKGDMFAGTIKLCDLQRMIPNNLKWYQPDEINY